MARNAFLGLLLFIMLSCVSFAADIIVFGPATYTRTTARPETVDTSFSARNISGPFTLVIQNGLTKGGRPSSAIIKLNGVIVASPDEFSKQVALIVKQVALFEENQISVQVRSEPGTSLVVSITAPGTPSSPNQIIDWLKASPSDVLVNTPTLVAFTAQVGLDATLIPSSALLWLLDKNGVPQSQVSPMYDDGTHGDVLPGDNIYTAQLVLNQPSSSVMYFGASVEYAGLQAPIRSVPIAINFVSIPTSTEVETILSLNSDAANELSNLLSRFDLQTARRHFLNYLRRQPDVSSAEISQDGTTIWIIYSNGLMGAALLNPPGTLGTTPSSNRGLVASPISTFSTVNNELVYAYNRFLHDCCVAPDPIIRDAAITVDFLKNLSNYGVISLVTHGGVDGSGQVVFQTGETASTFLGIPTSHLIDWALGRLAIGLDNFWLVRPSFISHYGSQYPGSIILLSMCHSLDNNTLSDAFISKGAKTVFGWQNSVTVSFAGQTKQAIIDHMIDNGNTTGQAYDAVSHIDMGITPNAVLKMAGSRDMILPVDLVLNGSFETGDFNGWIKGSSPGCQFPGYAGPNGYAAVVSGDAIDGSKAARLGRFDQLYTGGSGGPPRPGAEPCGYDWIYQDVQLPNKEGIELTFGYNIRTFDAAIWDWLDVFIKDPATDSTLATVVSHEGKPGSQYGTYWDGGWQSVTFDLSPWKGKKVRIWFGNHQDGYGDQNAVWIDKVSIKCY